jgi:ABC-type nitrate/sulfonate/bicarbonate transport system permease component
MKRSLWSALFFIALLFIWHLLVLAKIWSPVLLPDPLSVWEYLNRCHWSARGQNFVLALGALPPSALGHGTSVKRQI